MLLAAVSLLKSACGPACKLVRIAVTTICRLLSSRASGKQAKSILNHWGSPVLGRGLGLDVGSPVGSHGRGSRRRRPPQCKGPGKEHFPFQRLQLPTAWQLPEDEVSTCHVVTAPPPLQDGLLPLLISQHSVFVAASPPSTPWLSFQALVLTTPRRLVAGHIQDRRWASLHPC